MASIRQQGPIVELENHYCAIIDMSADDVTGHAAAIVDFIECRP